MRAQQQPAGSRRAFLQGAGAVAAVAGSAAAVVAAGQPDCRLIALCDEFDQLQARWLTIFDLGAGEVRTPPILADALAEIEGEQEQLLDKILTERATTLEGFRARAATLLRFDLDFLNPDETRGWNGKMSAALVRDLAE
jgi:hypothetical protein